MSRRAGRERAADMRKLADDVKDNAAREATTMFNFDLPRRVMSLIVRCERDDLVDKLVGLSLSPDAALNGGSQRGPGGVHDHIAPDLVTGHVERVVVHAAEVEIVFRATEVASPHPGPDGEKRVLRVPLERRSRDRREIIVPGGGGAPPRSFNRSLVLTVARGRAWANALRRGEYADTSEIARKHDLSEPYVKRMLRLAFLAPDIVEAIAEGRQPRGLNLQRLMSPLPLAWSEQRKDFGFFENAPS